MDSVLLSRDIRNHGLTTSDKQVERIDTTTGCNISCQSRQKCYEPSATAGITFRDPLLVVSFGNLGAQAGP